MEHGSTGSGARPATSPSRATHLPALPMLDLCAVVPGPAVGAAAGAEWCEVRGLDDGRAALVVGYAGSPRRPLDEVLRAEVLDRLGDGDLAGALARADAARLVCLALLDPATGRVQYGATGRPPLVVHPDGTAAPLPSSGTSFLGPEDVLLLYADSRTTSVDDDVLGSAAGVAFGGGRATEDLCCHLLDDLVTGGPDDRSLVLLAARRTPAPEPFDLTLPASAGSTGMILSAARDWLRLLGVSLRDRIAVDAVLHELCQNVVRHAYPALAQWRPLRARLTLAPTGVLETTVTDEGRWASGRERATAGFTLARAASDTLQVHFEPTGNRAVATHRVSREGPHVAGASATSLPSPRPAAGGW